MITLPAHITLDEPPWQPHVQSPVMSMGLKRIAPIDWLQREHIALSAYAANKKRQTQSLGDNVLRVMPNASEAVEELAQLVEKQLGLPAAAASDPTDRLHSCSLHVAEDLCLLQATDEGYSLDAAHLCAPSHWLLEDKIGRTMDPIHAPVPGYQPALARSVNLFLDKLSGDRLVERFNWSLDEKPALCQRPKTQSSSTARVLRWYRVERQTLRRLPETSAIVFTILVRQWPLWFLAQQEGGREGLEQALRELPPALRAYKSLADGVGLDWAMPSA